MSASLYFVSGVSGVGKTSIIPALKLHLPQERFRIHDLDERGVPDGGGRAWRLAETQYWIEEAATNAKEGISTLVCGFANPEELSQFQLTGDIRVEYILLDASPETIRQRLGGRYIAPESETEVQRVVNSSLETFIQNNVSFSSVLREICRKSGCTIIDTEQLSSEEVTERVAEQILKRSEPMLHQMKLQPTPFEQIQNGSKTIVSRLNDEKRQKIRIGDEIVFSLMTDPSQTLRVEVAALYPHKTFPELFAAFPAADFGGTDLEDLMSIYTYYTKEEEAKYGVLGIKVRLITPTL